MMTRYFTRSTSTLVSVASVLIGVNSVFAALYSVKDLGILADLPGRNDSTPNALSSNGKVAAANVTNGAYRAFLYDGAWTNLGTLGGSQSFAFGVNDSRLVVGRSLTANGVNRAFLWTPGGTNGVAGNPQMKDLGTFTGGTHSEADGINAAGQITGYAQTSSRDHAFRYSGGTMTDIGALLSMALPNSYGLSINDAGHIVGMAYDPFFTFSRAFFYNGSTAVDIGNLGGQGASALSINRSDHIAGYSTISTGFNVHAFHYFNGVMLDLGTLGGHYSYAIGINNSNVIVGGSFVDVNDSIYHAFVSVSNSLVDLNSELDASGAGWVLTEARAINDLGQIVGVGQFNGANHAFLVTPALSPFPAPRITSLMISGVDVLISFTTTNSASYSVEGSEYLTTGSWSNRISGIVGTGGIVTATNSGAAGLPYRFYRVRLSMP